MPGYNSQRRTRPALPKLVNFLLLCMFNFLLLSTFVLCILYIFYVQMCTVLLPAGVNPIAVKYIYIYIHILFNCNIYTYITECMLDRIDVYRRNWLLHLQRMPQNRIPSKSYRYSPQGKRTVGRPKKRWR
jgi:hypothetical protein